MQGRDKSADTGVPMMLVYIHINTYDTDVLLIQIEVCTSMYVCLCAEVCSRSKAATKWYVPSLWLMCWEGGWE